VISICGPILEMLVMMPMLLALAFAPGGRDLAMRRAQIGLAHALGVDRNARNQLVQISGFANRAERRLR
jgi:hypothetical protein